MKDHEIARLVSQLAEKMKVTPPSQMRESLRTNLVPRLTRDRHANLRGLEFVRDGLVQAYTRLAEHGDEVGMACMKAHYENLDTQITRLQGETIPLETRAREMRWEEKPCS